MLIFLLQSQFAAGVVDYLVLFSFYFIPEISNLNLREDVEILRSAQDDIVWFGQVLGGVKQGRL